MTEVKAGDIVRVLPFGPGVIDGIRCYEEMCDCIGEIHIVTRVNYKNIVSIDDMSDLYYPISVLEVIGVVGDKYTPYVYRMGRYIPVHYDEELKTWTNDDGYCFSCYQVGLIEKSNGVLPFSIFSVGERGDTVSTIRFRGKTYLDPKYLPMVGEIGKKNKEVTI